MRKPLHKRKRKWPTIEEFWTSEEPMPFKLLADDQSQWRKFRKWLKKALSDSEETKFDYHKDAESRFASEVDICLGNFHEKGVVNTKMAANQYDFTYFMTKDEIKKLTPE